MIARLPRFLSCTLFVLGLSTLASADEGMFLFNRPPLKLLKERYNFEPGAAWLERLQKSCLRVSTGGSASLVSPTGLVMTNHHVASEVLAKLSGEQNDYLTDGFLARSHTDELPCSDLELLSLWQIEDVTDKVLAGVKAGMSEAEAAASRRKAISEIEQSAQDSTGLKAEMVTLYQGGSYHLYLYKRYTDVRLVFAPEKQAGFFGGDVDNFEYPRYCLDITFFRIYEDDKPLHTNYFLPFSRTGTQEGDLVMLGGHPGRTERSYTVAHVEYLRDTQYPATMGRIWRREVQLQEFGARSDHQRRICEDDLFSVQNSRKLYTGFMAGILDPGLIEKKRAAERALKARVWADPKMRAEWGDAWDEIAAALQVSAEMYPRFVAIGRTGFNSYCRLFNIAKDLVRAVDERQKPSAERLRGYSDAGLQSLEFQLFADVPIYPEYEVNKMESWLALMGEILGGGDPTVLRALAGESPRARAEELVRGCTLMEIENRRKLYASNPEEVRASQDPMVQLVLDLDAENRAFRRRYEDEVSGPMASAYAKVAKARFAAEGDTVYPDATFSLRLAVGQVKGYDEGGGRIEPYTNFAGLYERAAARAGDEFFELDDVWIERKSALDLSVPYNFVHTCDSTGGNSGSPTIDRNGHVVGILFDGNIHSLICDLQYTEVQGRSVSVDIRGIVEAMDKIYQAKELLNELVGGSP
jgi:hypothetical protein